jgi:hypothetical protein
MIRYYADKPVYFVEDIIGVTPDPEQASILQSVAGNAMTSVRSGHGVGKTSIEAWAVIWFMATRPFPKVPCTSPTQHQLFDILWAEISKWLRNAPALEREFTWTREKIYLKGYPEEWFAVARTATKPDALQGFHADNVFFVIDEASGVSDKIFEPVLGALSTAGAKLLMCGNPTQLSGFFYESHHKNRSAYATHHIDGRKSSRVDKAFIKKIIAMYGEDSDVFRVRVAGEFPLQEDDVFIPLSLIETSVTAGLDYVAPKSPGLIHIGCDVARFGDDKTVIGSKVDAKIEFNKKRRGQDTMKTADDIIELAESLRARYRFTDKIPVKIDDGGVGGGVVDRLRQIKRNSPERFEWLEVFPVKFGTRIKNKHYHDSTSYMTGVVKKLLMPHDETGAKKPVELILPKDDNLAAQLSSRKYRLTEASKIQVESKDAMKKRGLPSPDEADCVLLLCLPVKMKT